MSSLHEESETFVGEPENGGANGFHQQTIGRADQAITINSRPLLTKPYIVLIWKFLHGDIS